MKTKIVLIVGLIILIFSCQHRPPHIYQNDSGYLCIDQKCACPSDKFLMRQWCFDKNKNNYLGKIETPFGCNYNFIFTIDRHETPVLKNVPYSIYSDFFEFTEPDGGKYLKPFDGDSLFISNFVGDAGCRIDGNVTQAALAGKFVDSNTIKCSLYWYKWISYIPSLVFDTTYVTFSSK